MSFAQRDAVAATLPPVGRVRSWLTSLEADFRELALFALASWERLEIVAPSLFLPVAALQRPSWGSWNGLLTALREARRTALREGTPAERDKIKQAHTLNSLLDLLDEEADAELAEQLQPLGRLVHSGVPRRARLGILLALPISLRNLVAHHPPPDPSEWWQQAADALAPLVEWQARRPLTAAVATALGHPSPWFLAEDKGSGVRAFNGFDRNSLAVTYTSLEGPQLVRETAGAMLLAFHRLFGKARAQEENRQRLLARFAPDDLRGVMLGDFLVKEPLGRGGFATVHKGIQLSTGRKVAVKVLRDGMPDTVKARFHQEAVYLSRLNHPHIVSVIGHGKDETWVRPSLFSLEEEGWFQEFSRSAPVKSYIAMELVDGQTLEEVYQGRREPGPDTRQLADWLQQAASALAAVNQAGLIHRDVKPSNIMIADGGAVKLMDFGIARTQGEIRTLETPTGYAPGTPAYMSPEQVAAGRGDEEVGPASDIYSLSATFYELFTSTRLFQHDTVGAQTVEERKRRHERPERPRGRAGKLPWEIETILLGGLEAEPSDRYRSMADLERDVRHFLRDEPIEYRRPSLGRRLRLWFRRNPRVAGLTATVAVLLVLGIIGSAAAAVVINNARNNEMVAKEQERRKAIENGALATKNGALATKNGTLARENGDLAVKEREALVKVQKQFDSSRRLVNAKQLKEVHHLVDRDSGRALQLLHDTRCCPLDLRDFTWWHLYRSCRSPRATASRRLLSINAVAFAPDGKTLATANEFGDPVVLWDATTGLPRSVLPVRRGNPNATLFFSAVTAIAYSPDGLLLAAGSRDGKVKLYDPVAGQERRTLAAHRKEVHCLAFSRDGKTLISAGPDGAIKVWEVQTGKELRTLAGHKGGVNTLTLSPDGRTLAAVTGQFVDYFAKEKPKNAPAGGMRPSAVTLYDLHNGKELRTLPAQPWHFQGLAFSADGQLLATGSMEGTIRLWDAASGREAGLLRGHASSIQALALAPDGRTLASASLDQTVRLWDLATRSERQIMRNQVKTLAYAPDGRTLAGAQSQGVLLWDLGSTPGQTTLPFGAAAISPDQRTVALVSGAALLGQKIDVRLFDLDTRKERVRLSRPLRGAQALAFTPDGRLLATGSQFTENRGEVRLWEVSTRRFRAAFKGQRGLVSCVRYSADGTLMAVASGHMEYAGGVEIRVVATGKVRRTIKGHTGPVLAVDFSPDNRTLATASMDEAVKLWDADTGKELATLKGHVGVVNAVRFSPDGKTLASGSAGLLYDTKLLPRFLEGIGLQQGDVRLWDVATRKQRAVLQGYGGLAFAPDGKTLATGGTNKTVKLWDMPTGKERTTLKGHTGDVFAVAFSPDGKLLASGSWDRTVKVWEVSPARERWTLRGHGAAVWGVAFAPDGRTLASGSYDRSARLWDAVTGQELATLPGHTGVVRSLDFSADGRTLAVGSGDVMNLGEVRLWDARTGKEAAALSEEMESILVLAVSPDGRTLAAGGYDGKVHLWDLVSRRPLAPLPGHANWVTCLAFAPDSRTLASGSQDGTVKLWDLARGKERATLLPVHPGGVRCLAFSPDDKLLASGGNDRQIQVRELATGSLLLTLQGHTAPVVSLGYSPDGRTLASASWGLGTAGGVKLWDAVSGEERATLPGYPRGVSRLSFAPDGQTLAVSEAGGSLHLLNGSSAGVPAVLREHKAAVYAVAFGRDGTRLVSGGGDGAVKVWDLVTGQSLNTLSGHLPGVRALALAPDGKTLAVVIGPYLGGFIDQPGAVVLWDDRMGKPRTFLTNFTLPVTSVAFSPDGKVLATGAGGTNFNKPGEVKLWDTATGKELRSLPLKTNCVWKVAFSPGGDLLAAGCSDGAVYLWDLRRDRLRAKLQGKWGAAQSVAFTPDGATVAAGHMYQTISLWDTATGKLRRTIPQAGGWVQFLAVSPDGKTLASGGQEGWVRLWDVATGKATGALSGYGGAVYAGAFAPDGRRIALGVSDGSVLVWSLSQASAAAKAAPRDRPLTPSGRSR